MNKILLLALNLGFLFCSLRHASEAFSLILEHSQGQRSRGFCQIEDGPLCYLEYSSHHLEQQSSRIRNKLESHYDYKVEQKKTFNVLESLLGSEDTKSFGESQEPFLVQFSKALGLDPLGVQIQGEVNLSKPVGEERLETGGQRQKVVQVVGETGQLGLTLVFQRPIFFKEMKYKTVGPFEGDLQRRLPRVVGSLDNQEVFAFDIQPGENLWKGLSLEEEDEVASIINQLEISADLLLKDILIGLDGSSESKEDEEAGAQERQVLREREREEERDPRYYEQVEFQSYYDHALANIDKD